jgi:plasmid maintenance system antidote protein VapI
VRRYLLKINDLSGADLGRILGVNRMTASRIMKGTSNLTSEQIKKLAG